MATSGIVIFVEPGAWRVAIPAVGGSGPVSIIDVLFPANATVERRTSALAEAIKAAGETGGRGAVIALQSRDCLCASIATLDLPARQRGQAMLYRFEEKLPVSAEEIIADFIAGDASALGIGVEKRLLEPVVAAVEAAGLRVRAICPSAMLALQHWRSANRRETPGGGAEMVLWTDGTGNAELFILSPEGRPVGWYVLSEDADDIFLHVRMAMLSEHRPSHLIACGLRPEILDRVRSLGVEIELSEAVHVRQAAAESGLLVMRGKRKPWVDFAGRGVNGRAVSRPATRLVAAMSIVLMVSLAAAMLMRAFRYERLAAAYRNEQQEVFRQALPGQDVPGDILSRLASEARQRTGSGPQSSHGLMVVRDVMTYLPANLRFRVFDMRLSDGEFLLKGEARSHADSQGIADALRRRPGFLVEAPRTELRAGRGVEFTISGKTTGEPRVVHAVERGDGG